MSKNKSGKNAKKAPAVHPKKTVSDYQAAKNTKEDILPSVKGKQ
ncbi:MAG TPA: hypothetical protein VL547_17835 [Dinghuibacter sp.]|jgi:hypothetical protein|nr:hypothetical protein [Dinghuibacter sp.]HTJ13905.1 hypothetical protein [Dinghuibacter sp.]